MKIRIVPLLFLLLLVPTACVDSSSSKPKVIIAASANMQYAIQEIASTFSKENQMDYEIILGSSGKLTAQIMEGAPYDIFISANQLYPKTLHQNNKTETLPKIYAEGRLVLWTCVPNLIPSLSLLASDSIQYIALANPKTAPYGKAASEIVESLPFFSDIKSKLVFGESISQTNQFITSRSAQIGFTSMGVVLSNAMKNRGNWVPLERESYSPLLQSAVILKNPDGVSPETRAFYEFLFSREAHVILKKYGFSIPY